MLVGTGWLQITTAKPLNVKAGDIIISNMNALRDGKQTVYVDTERTTCGYVDYYCPDTRVTALDEPLVYYFNQSTSRLTRTPLIIKITKDGVLQLKTKNDYFGYLYGSWIQLRQSKQKQEIDVITIAANTWENVPHGYIYATADLAAGDSVKNNSTDAVIGGSQMPYGRVDILFRQIESAPSNGGNAVLGEGFSIKFAASTNVYRIKL